MSNIVVTFLGTGAGTSIHRAQTAIVLDMPDGTRLLIDASSGNNVPRNGHEFGIQAGDFDHLLLTHHHMDHLGGLPSIIHHRTQDRPHLMVHGSEESLQCAGALCALSPGRVVDQRGAFDASGRQLLGLNVIAEGERIKLGPDTHAWYFPADHISGAVGWRIESDGCAIVFSGDTRFNPQLIEASRGARLLIHEAHGTEEEREAADRSGHCPAGDAGRSATLAEVEELVLTHFNTRYQLDNQPLLTEAKQHYEGPISPAKDGLQITVSTG